uniref:Uncharacterized protein n=1 Tax=Rhizophora mucronata TaxID=61149 RepID=A0A2P2N5T7_RHIMU
MMVSPGQKAKQKHWLGKASLFDQVQINGMVLNSFPIAHSLKK